MTYNADRSAKSACAMSSQRCQRYSWTRYWSPVGEEASAISDLLFQHVAPGSAQASRQPLVELDEECLVLLGEAGAGKSDELDQLKDGLLSREAKVAKLHLGEFGSGGAMFLSSEIQSVIAGEDPEEGEPLYLLLDALDETAMAEPLTAVRHALRDYETLDIRLRMTCRSAYWAFRALDFQKQLLSTWPEVHVYQIESLSKDDVLLAAKESGQEDPESFWDAVWEAGAIPLTQKPVTLQLLLDEYEEEGESIPTTRTKLYRTACRRLSAERESRRIEDSRLSTDERIDLLRRLAALTMFGQKKAIWLGSELERPYETDLAIDEAVVSSSTDAGRNDASRRADFYRREHLMEAARTGLLHSVRPSEEHPERVTWAERTLAEFMAAEYVIDQELSLNQLLDLLAAPSDEGRGIAPQMQDIAAWIGTQHEEVFQHLLDVDPTLLLIGDVAALRDEQRATLSSRVLEQYGSGRLQSYAHIRKPGVQHLSSPDLAEQLRPRLDASQNSMVRWIAVTMIHRNEVRELAEQLAAIALSPDEPLDLRTSATWALGVTGSREEKERLLPLAELSEKDDPRKKLRGATLAALYPDLIGLGDLLPRLEAPSRSDDSHYTRFVEDDLFDHLNASDLPRLFDWLEERIEEESEDDQESFYRVPHDLEHFADQLFMKAVDHLSDRMVCDALSDWIHKLADSYQELPHVAVGGGFRQRWRDDKALREQVVGRILDQQNVDFLGLVMNNYLAFAEDLRWVLQEAEKESDTEKKKRWAKLASHFPFYDYQQLVASSFDDPVVRRKFMERIEAPTDSGAEAARDAFRDFCSEQEKQRAEWERKREQKVAKRKQAPLSPQQVSAILAHFENRGVVAVWHTTFQAMLTRQWNDDTSDVTEQPVWQEADEDVRSEIVQAATRYLAESDPNASKWKTSQSVHGEPERAAIAALRLVQKEAPQVFGDWSDARWEQWATLMVAYEPVSGEDEDALRHLAERAYDHMPESVAETLARRIEAAETSSHPGYLPVLRRLDRVWDERLVDTLLGELSSDSINIRTFAALLPVVIKHGSKVAVESVKALLDGSTGDEREKNHALEAAVALLQNRPRESWDMVWEKVESEDDFAEKVFNRVAHLTRGDNPLLEGLDEAELGRLYLRLVELYPPEGDIDRPSGASYSPSIRDMVQSLRGAVFNALVEQGAASEMGRIQEALPNAEWLIEGQRRAEVEARRASWTPHAPQSILRLSASQSFRLGRTGAELLSAVVEVLEDMGERLNEHTPAVYDLWSSFKTSQVLDMAGYIAQNEEEENDSEAAEEKLQQLKREVGKGKFFLPKDENALSDYVQRYLKQVLDGVIVSREIQVRRGNFADIHLSTFTTNQDGREEASASVAIEVKGSWNQELDTALEDQLVGQYLTSPECRHGVYLVGWHYGPAWYEGDYRKSRARRGGIENLRCELQTQAKSVSRGNVVVCSVVADLSLPG